MVQRTRAGIARLVRKGRGESVVQQLLIAVKFRCGTISLRLNV